jgi:hypothetical protein
MSHQRVTEDEINRCLESQFNPPHFRDGFTQEMFYQEWKGVQEMIKLALRSLGFESWNEGGKDFTMSDDWGCSRHHEIEINQKRMIDRRVIPVLQDVISKFPQAYEILVEHDLFLREDIKPLSVVIRKNEVLTHTDDLQLLSRLGLTNRF